MLTARPLARARTLTVAEVLARRATAQTTHVMLIITHVIHITSLVIHMVRQHKLPSPSSLCPLCMSVLGTLYV